MNHRAIVLRQLNDELEAIKARQTSIEAAISALGGTLGGPGARKRRVRGPNKEKRVDGTNGAPEAPQAKSPLEPAQAVAVGLLSESPMSKPNGKPKGGDAPTLIRALKAIQARTDLTANERSAESLKARVAFKKGQSYAPPPVRKREGAVLGEAG